MKKKIIRNKNKGIVFWITGLSGSGKTTIAEKIRENVSKKYGFTLTISGDDLRELLNYKKYNKKSRLNYAMSYGKFCRHIADKKINVIFSTVSLFHRVQKWNRTHIDNYIEIYIQSNIKKIIRRKKKFFYKGNHKNVVGKNLIAEFPKYPDITIRNDFKKSTGKLAKQLIRRI